MWLELSHIAYVEEFLYLYIREHIICLLMHSENILWGIWVFGIHGKITILEPGTTCQLLIFWYVWRISSGWKQDMAIHGSTKGSHGCTKVWDGLSHGRYMDDIWKICGPRCGTYMEDASTSNWIKSSSRTEKVFFKGLKDEFFVVLFVCRTYKTKKILYI